LVVKVFELSTGIKVFSHVENIELAANSSTELLDLQLPKAQNSAKEPLVISTCLRSLPVHGKEETILARCTN
jgi:hypothetical protein